MSDIDNINLDTPIDRGAVKTRNRNFKKNPFFLVIPLVVVIVIATLIGIDFYRKSPNLTSEIALSDNQTITTPEDRSTSNSLSASQRDIRRQMALAEEARKNAAAKKDKEDVAPTTTTNMPSANVPNSQNTANGEPIVTPFQRKQQGSVLMNFDGNNSNSSNTGNQQANNDYQGDLNNGTRSTNANFNDELKGTNFANGTAHIRRNLDFLLIHGTNIPCVLKTKIVTNYKGLTICQIPRDIYSANGKILLFEKGSQIFGEQRVAITQGQARVFINWSDIETPYGISVRIDSLGTDTLGASGSEAWIDNHYKERFGAAVLLTLLDGVIQYAENAANDNNSSNGFTFNNSSGSASDIASKALESSINIPPTGYVNQGTLLNVLVARDVDMQNVYTTRYKE